MLEGFIIVIHKLVIIIWINEITILTGKNVTAADVDFRQQSIMWIFN